MDVCAYMLLPVIQGSESSFGKKPSNRASLPVCKKEERGPHKTLMLIQLPIPAGARQTPVDSHHLKIFPAAAARNATGQHDTPISAYLCTSPKDSACKILQCISTSFCLSPFLASILPFHLMGVLLCVARSMNRASGN